MEGYSNLLWVLIAAGVEWLGIDVLWGTRAVSYVGALASMVWIATDPRDLRLCPRRALAGAFLATSASVAMWTMGSLAAVLQLAWVTGAAWGAMVAVHGRPWGAQLAAVCLGGAVLTRADGAVLWVGLLWGWASCDPRGLFRAVTPWLGPPLLLSAQQAFRVVVHEDWVPNTARVKVTATWERTERGLWWTAEGLLRHGVLVVGAMVGWGVARREAALRIPMACAVTWLAYVAWVGGDIFAHWRHVVPVLGCFALVVADAAQRLTHPRVLPALGVAVVAHGLATHTGGDDERALGREWVRAGISVGEMLRHVFGPKDPLLAVDAAGTLPYASRLDALDMLGLNDRWLATHPPEERSQHIGHDLGNGDYVWDRAPDLIAWNSAIGGSEPHYRSGKEMVGRKEFPHRYQPMRVHFDHRGRTWDATFFVRKDGGPLGMVPTARGFDVPAWLLAAGHAGLQQAAPTDAPYVRVREDRPGKLLAAELPAGRWQVRAPKGTVTALRCSEQGLESLTDGPAVLELAAPTRVDLDVWAASDRVNVREVHLERTDAEPTRRCVALPSFDLVALSRGTPPGEGADQPSSVPLPRRGLRVDVPEGAARVALALGGDSTVRIRWNADPQTVLAEEILELPDRLLMGDHVLDVPVGATHVWIGKRKREADAWLGQGRLVE